VAEWLETGGSQHTLVFKIVEIIFWSMHVLTFDINIKFLFTAQSKGR
jgi:hypothetical protein